MTDESAQLLALISSLPSAAFDLYTLENRDAAHAIVEWFYCRPLARGDVDAIRATAAAALREELERQSQLPAIDDLVDVLRRTAP
jgi:hypothetical protein